MQNPHFDGQVEHVSSHPTEILVLLIIHTLQACVIEKKTAMSSSVMRERKKNPESCLVNYCVAFIAWLSIVKNIHHVLDFNKL